MYFIISLLQAHALSPDDFGIRMDGEVLTQGNLSFDTSFQRDGYQSFSYPTQCLFAQWEVIILTFLTNGCISSTGLVFSNTIQSDKGHSFYLPQHSCFRKPTNLTLPISHFELLWTGLPRKMIFIFQFCITWNEDAYMDTGSIKMDTVQILFW